MAKGPTSQENWKALLRGEPCYGTMEWPLFTDAWLTSEVRDCCGPYAFLNLIAVRQGFGSARPAAVLRADIHLQPDTPQDLSKTDHEQYHGGTFAEEVASLASLFLGVRMKAGGLSRSFEPGEDPKGRPIAWEFHLDPVLRIGPSGRVLPEAAGGRSLDALAALSKLPAVAAADAMALVRAARLYQEALWISESEPSLAWLLMVSSVESVANQWRRSKGSPVERLAGAKPQLMGYLERLGSR